MTDLKTMARDIAATNATDDLSRELRRRKILVVVDTQADFVMRYGLLAIAGAESIIVPGLGLLSNLASDEYAAVLFTYDTHTRREYLGSIEHLGQPDKGIPGFRLHCEKGTPGWENVFNARLVPSAIPVFELEKTVFDAWEKPSDQTLVYQTNAQRERLTGSGMPRDDFFDRLQAMGVDTATVVGVASDYCVKDQIRGLLARDLKVEVIEEVTAGIGMTMIETIAREFPGQVELVPANVPDAPPEPAESDGNGAIAAKGDEG